MPFSWRTFLLSAVVAWLIVALIASLQPAAAPPPPQEARAVSTAAAPPDPFVKWEDITDQPVRINKQDRVVTHDPVPVPVRSETVLPDAPSIPVPARTAVHHRHVAERAAAHTDQDICTRHHLHKTWTVRKHWRSWRCSQ